MRHGNANRQQLGKSVTMDRRHEARVPKKLTIEVSGFDRFSRYFTERTETSDVSDSGCQFRLQIDVAAETVVAVRATSKSRVASDAKVDLFRIVRICQGSQATLIGAQTLRPLQPHSLQKVESLSLTVHSVVIRHASPS
jgi:PilZ domain